MYTAEEIVFLTDYLKNFDNFVESDIFDFTFTICKNNVIIKKPNIIFGINKIHKNNQFLANGFLSHTSYTCCVNHKNEHLCSVFPIMIGSKIDALLHQDPTCVYSKKDLQSFVNKKLHKIEKNEIKFKNVNEEKLDLITMDVFEDADLKDFFLGYFMINGQIVAIPYILTNNREKPHKYLKKTKHSQFRLFLYNRTGKGNKFALEIVNGEHRFTYRDHLGIDHSTIPQIFDTLFAFDIDKKHINLNSVIIKDVLLILSTMKIDIDDLENKIMLSPTNILSKYLIVAVKDPILAKKILSSGNLQKLLSSKIEYKSNDKPCFNQSLYSVDNHNLYRQPNSNQLVKVSLLTNLVRPTQEHIKIGKNFPTNFNGFICPYDFSTNIKNFAKTMTIVHDIKCYQPKTYNEFDIMLNELLQRKIIKNYNTLNSHSSSLKNKNILLVKGCIPTKYYIPNLKFASFFHIVKSINPFFEIQRIKSYVILNAFIGLPMKPYKNFYISCYELKTFFPNYSNNPNFNCYSLTGLVMKAYNNYETKSKSMSAIGHAKSKIVGVEFLSLFFFTNEIYNIFLSTVTPLPLYQNQKANTCLRSVPVNIIDGTIELRVLFAGIPNITEDAYVVNENINFNVLIARKFNFEFNVSPETIIIPCTKNSCAQFIKNGLNRVELLVKVCTIQTNSNFNVHILTKLTCIKKPNNIYEIYKSLNYSNVLRLNSVKDIQFSFVYMSNTEKISILMYMYYKVPYFDGLKLSNNCGQKGICTFADLSMFKCIDNTEIDVIASACSIPGRNPFSQLNEMSKTIKKVRYLNKSTNHLESNGFSGVCKMKILRNMACGLRSNGLMKLDTLTCSVFNMNNCNLSIFNKIQDKHEKKYEFLPKQNKRMLECYSLQKTFIDLGTENNAAAIYNNCMKKILNLKNKLECNGNK